MVGSSLGMTWDEVKERLEKKLREGGKDDLEPLDPQDLEPLFHRYLSRRRSKAQKDFEAMLQESKAFHFSMAQGDLVDMGKMRSLFQVSENEKLKRKEEKEEEEDDLSDELTKELLSYQEDARYHAMGYDKELRESLLERAWQKSKEVQGTRDRPNLKQEDQVEEQDMDNGDED